MKNLSFRKKILFAPALIIGFCMMFSSITYAQTTSSATSTIGYFYSGSGQMTDAESNTRAMSSYLTRGERNDGTSETFAVSNIKDITADLDSNGNIINKYTYTAYGTQTSYTSNTQINESTNFQLSLFSNPFTYDGYYTDSESGNYYLNARYYDPTLGIFLTSDSYNLPNRYMYVGGNPVMRVDPTGHWYQNFCDMFHVSVGSVHGWHIGGGRYEDRYSIWPAYAKAVEREQTDNRAGVTRGFNEVTLYINKNNITLAQPKRKVVESEMKLFIDQIKNQNIKHLVVDLDENVIRRSINNNFSEGQIELNLDPKHPNAAGLKSALYDINKERFDAIKTAADLGVQVYVATHGPYFQDEITNLFKDHEVNLAGFYQMFSCKGLADSFDKGGNKVQWMEKTFVHLNRKEILLMDDSVLNISEAREAEFMVFQTVPYDEYR